MEHERWVPERRVEKMVDRKIERGMAREKGDRRVGMKRDKARKTKKQKSRLLSVCAHTIHTLCWQFK